MTTTTDIVEAKTPKAAEPLDIVAEKWRYPRLFGVYVQLSDRHKAILRDCGDPVPEGHCTKFISVDFEKPLEPLDATVPFKNDSVVNKFFSLVWNMLEACDSGSIGGDACRMNRVMTSAVGDIFALGNKQERIEHLLGLTIGIVNHGARAFFQRGDPNSGRRFFKKMADEWKEFFDHDSSIYNINEDIRKFAMGCCEGMQKMLKSTRDDYGEYATTYNFNFIRKSRKRASPEKENAIPTEKKAKKKRSGSIELELLMDNVNAVEGVADDDNIYDSCPEVRRKIRAFLKREGMTKAALCRAFGNINHNSLNRFLSAKGQKRAGTVTYRRAYIFFEKLRIFEGKRKSKARISNEIEQPSGFKEEKERRPCYVICRTQPF